MSKDLEFHVKQIVWASIDQYPPWPAKIIRKLHHNGKTVYKVHFFADPTYSFLHSNSLLPFNTFDHVQSQSLGHNLKLKRALELAKFCVSKHTQPILFSNNYSTAKPISTPNLSTPLEQTGILLKDDIDLPQKITSLSAKITSERSLDGLIVDQIIPSNVLELLESYQKGQIAQQLGNLKRKQIICFQNHLKQNLLLKYKLNAVDLLKPNPKLQQLQSGSLKELRTARVQKKKNQVKKFDEKEKSIRKIQRILYHKGLDRHLSYTITMKIIKEIEKRSSDHQKEINLTSIKFDSVRMIQQISSNLQQIQQTELEYIEKHILSFFDADFHNQKLEEGSRMTQLCEEFGA